MPPVESTFAALALWAAFGYLLGSVPFGLVLSKLMNLGDLRQIGSGNIGATNVLRTGNKAAAALTLLLDAGKGAAALLAARAITGHEDAAQLAGLAAMLGHCYPIWLRFKGGKGVATFIGLMLALYWPVGIGVCLAWLAGAALSRMSSAGALTASALAVPIMLILGYGVAALLGVLLAALIYWRHRENIRRILQGTEPKFGQKAG